MFGTFLSSFLNFIHFCLAHEFNDKYIFNMLRYSQCGGRIGNTLHKQGTTGMDVMAPLMLAIYLQLGLSHYLNLFYSSPSSLLSLSLWCLSDRKCHTS